MSGATQPMSVAIDVDRLAELMRQDGIDMASPLTAVRLGHGHSNLTYAVTDAEGRRWVVRRPPLGHRLGSAHDVMREYRILRALQDSPVSVPKTISHYVDSTLADVPVIVVELLDGLVIDSVEAAADCPVEVRSRIGRSLSSTLSAIHDVALDEVGLLDLASHGSYAARQLKRWSRQWEETQTAELPALDRLTDVLRRKMPVQQSIALVHGDFHIQNLILDGDTGDVRGVLDWELSTLGEPLADLGTVLAYWPEAGDPPTGLLAASALPGFATRAEIADAYLAASGRDGSDLAYWHVLGLWKIAIIAAGVRRRTSDDPRNATPGTGPGESLPANVLEQAWSIAVQAGLDR